MNTKNKRKAILDPIDQQIQKIYEQQKEIIELKIRLQTLKDLNKELSHFLTPKN